MRTGVGAALDVVTDLVLANPLKVPCPVCLSKVNVQCLRGSCYVDNAHSDRVAAAQRALGKALAALVLAAVSS